MRIALLTEGIFPFVVGGMQRHSTLMAKYLARREINLTVYHYSNNATVDLNEVFTEDELKYLKICDVPMMRMKYFPGHYFMELMDYSKRIFSLLEQENFDFIYIQGYAGLYPLRKNGFNIPTGINFHGIEFFQEAASFKHRLSNILLRYFANICFRNADYIFSLGGKLNQLYKDRGLDDKVIEVPIGIEGEIITKQINETRSPYTFLFVGRYEARKGIEPLNSALKELLSRGHEFNMEFVGPIPVEKQLQHEKVTYHGQIVDAGVLADIYKKSDVLLLPSTSEGMPTVILEAMARACAIVATDVGAVANMVNERNGYLLKDNSPPTLVRVLEVIINSSPEQLDELKTESLLKVKKYTWENVAKLTEETINRIIDNG